MVVDSILPYAECGPNDHRKDARPFIDGHNLILRNHLIRNTLTWQFLVLFHINNQVKNGDHYIERNFDVSMVLGFLKNPPIKYV